MIDRLIWCVLLFSLSACAIEMNNINRTSSGGNASIATPKWILYLNHNNTIGGSGFVQAYEIDQSTGDLTAVGSNMTLNDASGFGLAATSDSAYLYASAFDGDGADDFIHRYQINSATGELSDKQTFATNGNAQTFIRIDSTNSYLYAVSPLSHEVHKFSISGSDGYLNTLVTSASTNLIPNGLAIDRASKILIVGTTFFAGTVDTYLISLVDGTLTAGTSNANSNAPTYVLAHPLIDTFYISDNNGTQIRRKTYDPSDGSMVDQESTATGNAPYGMAITTDGNCLYVANKTDATISVFTLSGAGVPTIAETKAAGTNLQFLTLSPENKFLYASNFGDDTVQKYQLNAGTCALTDLGTTAVGDEPTEGLALEISGS